MPGVDPSVILDQDGRSVTTEIVFETHSTSEDNERGIATGWLPGRLSRLGREQARQLGERRRDDGIVVVFTSDLSRAVETAEIAFSDSDIPVLHDWRLRECDYGQYNGTPPKLSTRIIGAFSMSRTPAERAGLRR